MELHEMTASEAAEAIRTKEIKARELTEAVLFRLNSTDKEIKAFITVTADKALSQADAIDRMVLHNEQLPPLAGLPVALRDDICLEGFPATAGSKMLENFPAPYSAAVAEKTTEAGGIVVGKTNMDEFGMGDSTEHSSFQLTRNPLDKSCVAGDGTAAAVACGQSMLGIGADTGGGLRTSASYCGVTGLRTTPGLVSRYGITSFSSSMCQAGLLSRKAVDLMPLLDAIRGFDARDSSTSACPAEINTGNPERKTMVAGYPEEIFNKLKEPHRKILEGTKDFFSAPGYELKKIALPHFDYGLFAYYVIAVAESFSNLSRYDGIRYGYHYDGDNLEEWYRKTRRSGLGEEARRRSIIGAYLMNEVNFEKYYEKALRVWNIIKDDFNRVLQDCDLLLLPAAGTRAPGVGMNSDFTRGYETDEFCAPVSLAGLPSLCLPAGEADGMPVSIQLTGPRFSEKMLINLAGRLEKDINYKVSPVV